MDDAPPPQRWGLGDVLVALGIVVGAIILSFAVVIYPAWAAFGEDSTAGRFAAAISTLLAEASAALAIYRLQLRPKGIGLASLGFRLPRQGDGRRRFTLGWLGLVFGAWVVALIMLVSYVYIVSAAGFEFLEPPDEQIPSELFSHWVVIVALGASVLIGAPLFEELFFRGFVFPALARVAGVIPGAVGSGFLFSLAHLDPGFIIPFAAIGTWFAYLYRRTDSLYTSMLCHFLFNFVAFSALVAQET
jgi:membrane protease YdiL (CAAX protease family)